MAEIPVRITQLEAILENPEIANDHTQDELEEFEEELNQLRLIDRLWGEFGDIPMNPETECIESPFAPIYENGVAVAPPFPAGTHREDIWHWFERQFCISVAEDLMY